MTLDVVYVSYRKDLAWLCYSLQLLHKFFHSNFGTVVRVEPDCKDVIDTWGIKATYHYVKPFPDGYAFQMFMKMTADLYSQADLIMLLDSDHMLLERVYLEDFLRDGKPVIRYRNWDDDLNDPNLVVGREQWCPPVERTLGIPLDRDYMVGSPFIFWRGTFAAVRNRVEQVTGRSFHDVLYSDRRYDYKNFLNHPKTFCDYNALGLYAAKFEPQRYALLYHGAGTHIPFKVYWSHGHWSDSVRAELDRVLRTPLHEPFNGDRFLQAEIERLIQKHKVATVIETGTYHGDTTRALASMVPQVITIELSQNYFEQGTHLDQLANVNRLLGDSGRGLAEFSEAPGPILYYLDAHWENHSPLLDELKAIALSKSRSIIVIHDFKNPRHPEYGYDTWDIGAYEIELISPVLKQIYPSGYSYHFNDQAEGQQRGVIYIEPN